MISVVVCSVNIQQFTAFEENVRDTIGVPHEIVRVDNSQNTYSIFSAYNEGTARARYDILCFSHEDILIRTENWGQTVLNAFAANKALGILGIAGSTYKSYTPAGWSIIHESRHVNIIQHYKHLPLETTHDYVNPDNKRLARVVCVDGVWMCTRKSVAVKHPFDQQTFKGFHCYDLDFCMSVFQSHEINVTFDVLLEHFSEGRNDKPWVEETMKFHRKWRKHLPVHIDNFSNEILGRQELYAADYFIDIMLREGFSLISILRVLNYNKQNPHIGRAEFKLFRMRKIKETVKRDLVKYHLYKDNRATTP